MVGTVSTTPGRLPSALARPISACSAITLPLISGEISLPNSTVKAVSPQERYRTLTSARIAWICVSATLVMTTFLLEEFAMAATNAGFVNINSDLGESFGPWVMGNDAEVLKIVKSANVACGFHASDPVVMVDTVKLCQQNGVSIGAHPGFADLQGFGRRVINLTIKELEANIAYQIGALQAIAALHGAKVTH